MTFEEIYDPEQVAIQFHSRLESQTYPLTMAGCLYHAMHSQFPAYLDEHGRPVGFTLPPEEAVFPILPHLDVQCLAIKHTRTGGYGWNEDPKATYLVFEDLSFLAWDDQGPVDEDMSVDNSADLFRFEDLADKMHDATILTSSKVFIDKEGSIEGWLEKWGPLEARHPENPEEIFDLYYEIQSELHNVRDPLVDHYAPPEEEWSLERAAQVEEEIFDVAAAILLPGHRLEITINSAVEHDEEAEIDLEHYGPKGIYRRASLEIFERALNLHGLYGYQLEYSDSGDRDRMSSHFKTGVYVASLIISQDSISAHEHIEGRNRLIPALVKSGLSIDQAEALLIAAQAGDDIPEGIPKKSD